MYGLIEWSLVRQLAMSIPIIYINQAARCVTVSLLHRIAALMIAPSTREKKTKHAHFIDTPLSIQQSHTKWLLCNARFSWHCSTISICATCSTFEIMFSTFRCYGALSQTIFSFVHTHTHTHTLAHNDKRVKILSF